MRNMGYENPNEDHIYGTSRLAAKYVKDKYPGVKKVLVIGMKSLRDVLEAQGLEVVGAEQDIVIPGGDGNGMNCDVYDEYELDPDIGAVVLGLDSNFTVLKLQLATLYINELKAKLIVTNADHFIPLNGLRYPSNGSILASILATTNLT